MDYKIKHQWASRGYDGQCCWVQARAGAIPPGFMKGNHDPVVVMTMQKLLLAGSDVFYELNETHTTDFGSTWSEIVAHPKTLGRRRAPSGVESVICDATPRWHAPTGKLLSTGHMASYVGDALEPGLRRRTTTYTTFDPEKEIWSDWQMMVMPDMEDKFFSAGAGCTQRFDLETGEILLPIYFKPRSSDGQGLSVTVVRCSFDGEKLHYLGHGTEHTTSEGRGLGEPSITRFQGRFYLTMRNDLRGYVSSSDDGTTFTTPRVWTFDDGAELGSYNTQQHWVTHDDALYLVYSRRGLNNDHVFRHRAPPVMAQVDPQRLCVIRDSERVIIPERGARLGNFAITEVNENETWVVAAEWMQNGGRNAMAALHKLGIVNGHKNGAPYQPSTNYSAECEAFGSDNTIWVARIIWEKKNNFPHWLK